MLPFSIAEPMNIDMEGGIINSSLKNNDIFGKMKLNDESKSFRGRTLDFGEPEKIITKAEDSKVRLLELANP